MSLNPTLRLQSVRTQWLVTGIAFGLLAIVLWLPYGLNIAGWGDEWIELASADAGSPLVSGTLRAFVHTPYIIAHALTPDSFAGMNLILLLMSFGRGLVVYALLRRLLPEYPALAFVAGALTIVYPGDLAFYLLVSISITTALVCFLLAMLLLVYYWRSPRWYFLLLMWALLAYSVGIYEVSYPLIAVVPLLLVYLNKGLSSRVIRVTALWYLVPLIYVILVFMAQSANSSTASYQLSIVNPDNAPISVIIGFASVYVREFARVWLSAAENMPQGFSDMRTWLSVIASVVMGGALLIHKPTTMQPLSLKKGALVIISAAVAVGLAYFLFAFTISRGNYARTLFYALPFASIVLATLALLLTRLERIPRWFIALLFAAVAIFFWTQTNRLSALFAIALAVGFLVKSDWRYAVIGASLIGIAGANAIGFHKLQPYADLPERQHQLASSIVTQAPAVQSGSLILLIAPRESQEAFGAIVNRYDILQSMLRFIYKQPDIEAQICVPDGVAWGDYQTVCQLDRDAVTVFAVNSGTTLRHQWTYDRVIAFGYQADTNSFQLLDTIPPDWMSETGAEAYQPQTLIRADAPLPSRLQAVWTQP